MHSLSLRARVYITIVIAAGGGLMLVTFPIHGVHRPGLFIALLVLSAVTSKLNVRLPVARGESTLSVSYAIDFTSLLLLGAADTMVIAAVSAGVQSLLGGRQRKSVHRALFSMAAFIVTVQGAGLVYRWLGGQTGIHTLTEGAGPLIGAAATYFALNTLLVGTVIALSTEQALITVWRENFLWSAPSYFVGALVAGATAVLFDRQGGWVVGLMLAPVYLTYKTYKIYLGRIEQERHVKRVSDLHLATIEALALAIDAKDQRGQMHIRRMQVYASALARVSGMTDQQIEGLKTAAVLHDIGKLAVPDDILSKPGPLTPEEFQRIRIHSQVGAEIISGVPFPYQVGPLILSHHERWDGTGYPAGLKGEDIPLGARILAVVDCFDALTSDRPYRKAMSREAALNILEEEAGKTLDPVIVTRFVGLLPKLIADLDAATESHSQAGLVRTSAEPRSRVLSIHDGRRKKALDDIALAHREIYALYDIAHAMGTRLGLDDTMAIVSSKLSKLVPFSCCALFLYDSETDSLACRFASGTDADVVRQIVVKNGEGMTGWVARNMRPLVNARPSADLEAAGLPDTLTLKSALVCPLIFGEQFIGALSVYHVDSQCYAENHRRLLDRVCEQAAAVVSNSIVFERTQEDSLTDPLTGLANTRFMLTHLTRELARAERLKTEVALIVVDLDNFKEINDTYGHYTGDRALSEVATILESSIRPYDMCVRYAGDEFVLILSGCSTEKADQKRLEIQDAIDRTPFRTASGDVQLSISAGAAVYPNDGATYEDLLGTADTRMYADKTIRKRRTSETMNAAAAAVATPPASIPDDLPNAAGAER